MSLSAENTDYMLEDPRYWQEDEPDREQLEQRKAEFKRTERETARMNWEDRHER